jgi:hypothetical protein
MIRVRSGIRVKKGRLILRYLADGAAESGDVVHLNQGVSIGIGGISGRFMYPNAPLNSR